MLDAASDPVNGELRTAAWREARGGGEIHLISFFYNFCFNFSSLFHPPLRASRHAAVRCSPLTGCDTAFSIATYYEDALPHEARPRVRNTLFDRSRHTSFPEEKSYGIPAGRLTQPALAAVFPRLPTLRCLPEHPGSVSEGRPPPLQAFRKEPADLRLPERASDGHRWKADLNGFAEPLRQQRPITARVHRGRPSQNFHADEEQRQGHDDKHHDEPGPPIPPHLRISPGQPLCRWAS
jgi:hypothetical protein